MRGAIIGFLLALIGVTLSTWLAFDIAFPSALALGVFIGFWGGIGFGVMVGGVIVVARDESHG